MILPGTTAFEGVIGTTFDGEVTVYPATDSLLKWEVEPVWKYNINYEIGAGVIGSNGKAYKSLKSSLDKDPTTETEYWQVLTSLNITGYKSEIKIGNNFELVLKNGEGITIVGEEGKVRFKAKREQTKSFIPGSVNFALFMEDLEENYYEYISAKVKWKNP